MLRNLIVTVVGLALLAAACGDSDAPEAGAERPTVVVTTSILGDVVTNLVGDQAEVVTIMPTGADPHAFQASARQVAQIGEAEVLITNGGDFEEGLVDVIEAARDDGVKTLEVLSSVATIPFVGDDDHGDDDHGDDDHGDEDHDHEGEDPHFFTDPARMAIAAEAIVDFLAGSVDGIDGEALRAGAQRYLDQLEDLDVEVEQILDAIPASDRVLVTNHEVFGYFADRYGFEVVGTVIPGGTTIDSVSAGALAELAGLIRAEGVAAIFADTSSTDELAETLAAEVGDVAVVELYSESLGPPDSDGATYVEMMRTNAQRIAAALAR